LILRQRANGVQSYEPVADFDPRLNRYVPRPIDLGAPDDQVFLILFGTGIRQRSALEEVRAALGGAPAEVLFAGTVSGLAGLDQLNLRLSPGLRGRGEVEVFVQVGGQPTNHVTLNVR
jgi:uncharacterized protein (TIGR03437 family)